MDRLSHVQYLPAGNRWPWISATSMMIKCQLRASRHSNAKHTLSTPPFLNLSVSSISTVESMLGIRSQLSIYKSLHSSMSPHSIKRRSQGCVARPHPSVWIWTTAALAALTLNATLNSVIVEFAEALTWESIASSMLTAMLVSIVNKKLHGRLLLSVTKLTLISSSAQTPFNAVPRPIAGMCPKKIVKKMSRNAFPYILRKRVLTWDGNQTILWITWLPMTIELMACIASRGWLSQLRNLLVTAQPRITLFSGTEGWLSLSSVTQLTRLTDAW